MGTARRAAAGDNYQSFHKARRLALATTGVPIPGMGGHHSFHKSHGGGNKIGAITRPNKEWGSYARKQEEHQTGIARRAKNDHIAEQLAEMVEVEPAEVWSYDEWDAWGEYQWGAWAEDDYDIYED